MKHSLQYDCMEFLHENIVKKVENYTVKFLMLGGLKIATKIKNSCKILYQKDFLSNQTLTIIKV